MKLSLQIAIGVFLGTLSSQFAFEGWHMYQEKKAKEAAEKLQNERRKVYLEQAKRLRSFMQNQPVNPPTTTPPPLGFVPGDVKEEINKKK